MCSASLTLIMLLLSDDASSAEERARGKPEVFLAEATPQDWTTSMETMAALGERDRERRLASYRGAMDDGLATLYQY